MTRAEAPQLALPVPLIGVLPDFAAEVAEALRLEEGAELADQLSGLSITAVCGCGDDFCASFYTGLDLMDPGVRSTRTSRRRQLPEW